MFMLSAHYRTPLNYSAESLEMNKASLARLYEARNNMEFRIEKASGDTMTAEETEKLEALKGYKQKFIDAMDDDLNTARRTVRHLRADPRDQCVQRLASGRN